MKCRGEKTVPSFFISPTVELALLTAGVASGMATKHEDGEVDHQDRFPTKQESSVGNQHTRK